MPSRKIQTAAPVQGDQRPPLARKRALLVPRDGSRLEKSRSRSRAESIDSSCSYSPEQTGRSSGRSQAGRSSGRSRGYGYGGGYGYGHGDDRYHGGRSRRGGASQETAMVLRSARNRRSRSRSRRGNDAHHSARRPSEETAVVLHGSSRNSEDDKKTDRAKQGAAEFEEYCKTAAAALEAGMNAGFEDTRTYCYPPKGDPRIPMTVPTPSAPSGSDQMPKQLPIPKLAETAKFHVSQVSHLNVGLGLSTTASTPLLPKNKKKKKTDARIAHGDLGSDEARLLRGSLVNAIGVSGEGLKHPQNMQDAVVAFVELFGLGETEALADIVAACALTGSLDCLRLVLGQLNGNIAPDGRNGRSAITFPLYQRVCDHIILSAHSEFANDALLALLEAKFAPAVTEFPAEDIHDYFIRNQHFLSLEFAEDMRSLISQALDGRGTMCKVSSTPQNSKGYGKGGYANHDSNEGLFDIFPLTGSKWSVKSDRFQNFMCYHTHGPQDAPGRGDVLILKVGERDSKTICVGVVQSSAGLGKGAVTVAVQQIRVLQGALHSSSGTALCSIGPSKVALDRMRSALVDLCRRTTQVPAMQYWLVARRPTPMRKQTNMDKKTLKMHLRLRPRDGESQIFESQAATSTEGFSAGKITGELLFMATNPHGARECTPGEASGKIVVFWRGALRPEKQARHAAAGGASGVVVVDDDDSTLEHGESDGKDTVFISFPANKSPGLKLNQDESGTVVIASVEPGSPATGKVFEGDIVREVNGSATPNVELWRQLLGSSEGEPPSVLFKINKDLEGRPMVPVVMVRREDGQKFICEAMMSAARPKSPLAEIVVSEYGPAGEISIKMNQSQLEAIKEALNPILKAKTGRTSLIQGPPGTGKTTVALQIIEAWLKKTDMQFGKDGSAPACKIMVTGFSNVAIDNIGLGLQKLGLGPFLRVGRGNTILNRDTLQEQMVDHPSYGQLERMRTSAVTSGAEAIKLERKMSRELVTKARIILATCVTSGGDMLSGFNFKRILFDEATQATEAASLIPIIKGCEELVLIGDHKQLPPLIHSSKSLEYGLHESLFERLLRLGVPAQLLSVQYRMHPALAAFPSMTFYDNRVTNGVWAASRPSPQGYPWPDPHAPICFEGIGGPDDVLEEKAGTSLKNAIEAERVFAIVEALLGAMDVPAEEIGVITPYSAQAAALKSKLRPRKLNVSTVDSYQGRETDVVICSTVRCSPKRGVGFLSDRRRFNVLLTRARRGLIVVGHEATLRLDPCWCDWIGHVAQHRLFKENLFQSVKTDAERPKHGFDVPVPLETDMSKVPEEILSCPGRWMAFAKGVWPGPISERIQVKAVPQVPHTITEHTFVKAVPQAPHVLPSMLTPSMLTHSTVPKTARPPILGGGQLAIPKLNAASTHGGVLAAEPDGVSANLLALANAECQAGEAVAKLPPHRGVLHRTTIQKLSPMAAALQRTNKKVLPKSAAQPSLAVQRFVAAAATRPDMPLRERVGQLIKTLGHAVVPTPFFLESGLANGKIFTALLVLTGIAEKSGSVTAEGKGPTKADAEKLCYRHAWKILTGTEVPTEVSIEVPTDIPPQIGAETGAASVCHVWETTDALQHGMFEDMSSLSAMLSQESHGLAPSTCAPEQLLEMNLQDTARMGAPPFPPVMPQCLDESFPPAFPPVMPAAVAQPQTARGQARNPMPGASLGQLKRRLLRSRLFLGAVELPLELLQEGPAHQRVFTYSLSLPLPGGPVLARGSATTKKEAERICCADAVRLIS